MKQIIKIDFQDALSDGNAIVATLCSLSDKAFHTIMIYAFDDKKKVFKVKDSYGIKYQIPIERPDFYQVRQ